MKKLMKKAFKFIQKIIDIVRGKNKSYYAAIYMDISGCCNAKCSYCVTGVGKHSPKTKFMSSEKFEEIIKHLIKLKILNKKLNNLELYNYGEPFINSEFDKILTILGKYGLKAGISSNFIKMPDISPENYKNLGNVILSLCSLDEENYKKIYKADLTKVLKNYDEFLKLKNIHNPDLPMAVNWIKYTFNKNELENAKKYFNGRGVFNIREDYYGQLMDFEFQATRGSENNIEDVSFFNMQEARKDIDFEREGRIIEKFAPKPSTSYKCPQDKILTIGEEGQLVLCCCVNTQIKKYYNLGNILLMDRKKITKLKNSAPICKQCISSNCAWFAHEHQNYCDEV